MDELIKMCGGEAGLTSEAVDTLLQLGYLVRKQVDGAVLYKLALG